MRAFSSGKIFWRWKYLKRRQKLFAEKEEKMFIGKVCNYISSFTSYYFLQFPKRLQLQKPELIKFNSKQSARTQFSVSFVVCCCRSQDFSLFRKRPLIRYSTGKIGLKMIFKPSFTLQNLSFFQSLFWLIKIHYKILFFFTKLLKNLIILK